MENLPISLDAYTTALIHQRQSYGLDSDELKFVLEVTSDFDVDRSYATCYSLAERGNSAAKMMARADIQAAIIKELNFQGERLLLKKEALMSRIWAEALNMRSKPTERLKALELLARMIGSLDLDKKATPPSVTVNIKTPSARIDLEQGPGPARGILDITPDDRSET